MEPIHAQIVVTIPERKSGKTTFLKMQVRLPVVPPVGSTLTVRCADDDPLPLIVDHLGLTLGYDQLYVSTSVPRVQRVLSDERAQEVKAAEQIEMLVGAGFTVDEVHDDTKPPRRRPHK